MRLYTVQVNTPVGGIQRLMAEQQGHLVDLNAAGGVYYAAQGDANPQQLADANLPNDMITFFHNGKRSLDAGYAVLAYMEEAKPQAGLDGKQLVYDMQAVTILAPVTRPNIVFDGMVYEGHVKHHYGEIPAGYYKRPVWNTQSGSTVVGTGAPLFKPKYTEMCDFEFEMGFYIGKSGCNIKPEEALDYVAGFTVFNDMSARDAQADEAVMALGPAKGKFFRNSLVMGPCVVTKDELPDYDDLAMTARVNGEVVTENRTSGMLFSLGELVAKISEDAYLHPGDFIGLGTSPEGNATCSKLGRWLKVGDEIEFTIEKIGTICNKVVE
ncbi:MAG: fumarylacetoacetate hydrolase family protein [Eubacteriales bacterium]|nr:fumarylacetoacetate hydrolase family protein [Eubacteriales bacterium]